MTIKTSILAAAEKSANGRGKPYFMGNGSIVAVPGTLNQIYVTNSAGQVGVVYNSTTPNSLGYVCYVKLIDKKLQVTAGWDFYNTYVAPKVGPHWWTHAWTSGGSDIVPVSGDQFLPWIVQPDTTYPNIIVKRTPIQITGGWAAGGDVSIDLTSHIPGSGARYVLLSVGATGTITVTNGGTEALPTDLTYLDYPTLPTGDKPLYLVILYHGQTILNYNPVQSDFVDLRWMEAGGGGGGTGDVVGPSSSVDNNVMFFDGITGKLAKDRGITLSGSNTGDQTLPVKASGSELDTGTDDAKFATAKALKDSHNVPSVVPSTAGNVLTSDGTDWISAPNAGGGIGEAPVDGTPYARQNAAWVSAPSGGGTDVLGVQVFS